MKTHKPNKQKGTQRRNDILAAFIKCVREKGYAKTTMVDVAKAANVFPSNLFYYFDNKDEILRVCFQQQCDIIVQGLAKIEELNLEEKIDYIADFLFTECESVNHFTTGFMYEALGISVNDSILSETKNEMDRRCIELIAEVFVGIDPDSNVRAEKAKTLYSLLAGSKLNGFFDPRIGPEYGKDAFKKVMRIFCRHDLEWSRI